MLWIARNKRPVKNVERRSPYCIFTGNPIIDEATGEWSVVWPHLFLACLSAKQFHRNFKGLRLKPGEGPVEIAGFQVVVLKEAKK